jgi:hypothetical protein
MLPLQDFLHVRTAAAFTRFLADGAAIAAVSAATGILGFGREVQAFPPDVDDKFILAYAAYGTFAECIAAGAFPLFVSHGLAIAAISAGTDVNNVTLLVDGEVLVGKGNNSNE